MLSIYLPTLGELTVLVETLEYREGLYHLRCNNVRGEIHCSKISWQEDYIYEYGWVNIVSYTIDGVTTSCNHYSSIG